MDVIFTFKGRIEISKGIFNIIVSGSEENFSSCNFVVNRKSLQKYFKF